MFEGKGVADRQLWINVCEIMIETEKEMKAVRTNVYMVCGRSQAHVMMMMMVTGLKARGSREGRE